MAKQTNNRTDALFRQKLENFETLPPEASWQKIQGQLNSGTQFSLLQRYGFLAILLLFTTGISYIAYTTATITSKTQSIDNKNITSNQQNLASISNNTITSQNNLSKNLQNKLVDIDAANENDIINSTDQKSLINNFVANILDTSNNNDYENILATNTATQNTTNTPAKGNNNQQQNSSQALIAMSSNTANLASLSTSILAPVNPFKGLTTKQINNQFPPAPAASKKKKEATPISLAALIKAENAMGVQLIPSIPKKSITTQIASTLEGVKVPNFYPEPKVSKPKAHFGAMHLLSHTWRTSALDEVYLQNQAEDYKKNLQLGNSLGLLLGITTPKKWVFEAQFFFFSRQATEFTYTPTFEDTSISLKVPEVTINLRYFHLPLTAKKQVNVIPSLPGFLHLGLFAGPQFTILKSGVVTTLDGNKTDNAYRSYEIGAIVGTDLELNFAKNWRFRLGFNTMATNKPKYLFNPKQNTYSLHSGLTSAITYQF